MKKAIVLSTLVLLAMVLTGCYDMSYLEKPVDDKPELKAAMDDAARKLIGKWKLIKIGTSSFANESGNIYLTFIEDSIVIYEDERFDLKNESILKLGYDWSYRTNSNQEKILQGHIYFSTRTALREPFKCRIESNNREMSLYPDYDNVEYFDDPTMYFEKK